MVKTKSSQKNIKTHNGQDYIPVITNTISGVYLFRFNSKQSKLGLSGENVAEN